jgi:hypothetical protein
MDLETDVQISYDILQRIKNVKDIRSCLDGLKLLHKALQSPQRAVGVLDELSSISPRLEEILAIWDASAKCQHEDMQKMAIIVVIDLLKPFSLNEQDAGTVGKSSREAVLNIAHELVSSRIKVFYYHLSSSKNERISASLLLLASVCSFSLSCTEEVVQNFDFSLSALSGLARPRKQRKDEPQSAFYERMKREWNETDPLRRPTRCAFISWVLSLLRNSNPHVLKTVLRIRPLTRGVLHSLSSDPPNVQIEVLTALRVHVVVGRDFQKPIHHLNSFSNDTHGSQGAMQGSSLSAADRSHIWTDAALGQLSKISAQYEGTLTSYLCNCILFFCSMTHGTS